MMAHQPELINQSSSALLTSRGVAAQLLFSLESTLSGSATPVPGRSRVLPPRAVLPAKEKLNCLSPFLVSARCFLFKSCSGGTEHTRPTQNSVSTRALNLSRLFTYAFALFV